MEAVRSGAYGPLFRPGLFHCFLNQIIHSDKKHFHLIQKKNNQFSQIILYSANLALETIGQKVITLKVLSLLTLSWMLFGKSAKTVTVCRWAMVLDLFLDFNNWVHFWHCCKNSIKILGFPTDAFVRWWHRFRHGNIAHIEDSRRISRQNNEHLLGGSVTKSVWHRCRAIQCNAVNSSIGRKHRRNVLHWQRSTIRHLL